MSGRDELRGKLAKAESELDRYKTLWDGKVRSIRNEVDPYEPAANIDTELIVEYANDLKLLKKKIVDATALVKKLDRELNG